MSKLSPKERALLDVARKGWGPSASVTRAVRSGIPARLREEPTLGMDAPGPQDVTPTVGRFAAARAFARSPWGAVTGLTLVGLCVVFGARGALLSEQASPSSVVVTPAVEPAAPSPPLPPPAPQLQVTPEVGTVALDSLPDAPATKKSGAPPNEPRASAERAAAPFVAANTPSADTLAEEVALVRSAQRSLRNGSPADALASLATHASRFPNGALREERMTLQVLSLCALGDLPKARAFRAELERVAPASSHLQRLSCAAEAE